MKALKNEHLFPLFFCLLHIFVEELSDILMKGFYYLLIVALYIFVAVCALFAVFVVPGYATLKVASLIGAAMAFPYFAECWKRLQPGSKE